MADSDILKEYLIALGFKIDETQLRKFNGAIGQTTKLAVSLGAAVVSATTAVEAFVGRVSGQMEKLYYASQRSGAVVSNLMAIEAAAGQIGMTSDQIRGSIESLGAALRSQPGLAGYLKSLGIDPANKDTVEIFLRLIGKLKEMGAPGSIGHAVAQQIGQQFGISPSDLTQYVQNQERLTAATAAYAEKQKAAGVNAQELAEKSVAWTRAWNELEQSIGIVTQRLADDFLPLATDVIGWLKDAVDWFVRLDQSVDGWAARISTVAVGALGAWIAKATLLRTVLKGVATDATAAAAAGGQSIWARILGSPIVRWGSGVGAFIAGMQSKELNKGEDEAVEELWRKHGSQPSGTGDKNLPIGIRQNNPGNLRRWGGADTVNGFAAFPTAIAGLSAMAQNLLNYSKSGIRTIAGIIQKWAPAADGNNVAAYIAHVIQQTGYGEKQILDLKDPAVLESLMKAMINHENGQQPYDDETIRAAIAGRLGLPTGHLVSSAAQNSAIINQNTSITVNGASDPKETARVIGEEQDRVNAEIVRNVGGAFR